MGVLIAANVLPVFGVLFWGWSTGEIILLYWAENVIVGLVNIAKILICQGKDQPAKQTEKKDLKKWLGKSPPSQQPEPTSDRGSPLYTILANVPIAVFFTVHYGMFTLVHGVFVFAMFVEGEAFATGESIPVPMERFSTANFFGFTLLGLFASHVFSFFYNFVGGKQYLERTSESQMLQPYGRIVVLHISIIFGGFLLMMLGGPVLALILFVALKTVFELGALRLQSLNTLE